MIRIARILCPVDFSDCSKHALQHAAALARWYEAELTLLHVVTVTVAVPPYPDLPAALPLTPTDRERITADLEQMAAPIREAGVTVHAVVRDGAPTIDIVAHAEEQPPDLIVVGTHGRSGFDRFILGSVAERVLRKAPCPVLSVPEAAAGVPQEVLVKSILCPVDFSPASLRALDWAVSLAQEAQARLALLHVVEFVPQHLWRDLGGVSLGDYQQKLIDQARGRLRQTVPAETRTWCEVTELVVPGTPYREILRAADEQQAQLIVMGVHGRGALDLLVFGSATQQVLRHAACPVLTLRAG